MLLIKVAVAGATGLVGGLLLRRLLDDPEVSSVIAPTRRALPPHPKLSNPITTGGGWPVLPPIDEAYGCLGTTRAAAGSDEAFRAVDFDLAVSFARASKAAGARRFGLISSIGADAHSRFLYPRTKAEAEAAASGLGFENVAIVRPAFLLGERPIARRELAGELTRVLAPLMLGPLRRWRPVQADAVASSLISALRGRVPGALILESDAIH